MQSPEGVLRVPQKTREQLLEEGVRLRKLQLYEQAIATDELAIRLDPHFTQAYDEKAKVLRLLGRSQEAQRAHERAIQLACLSSNLFKDCDAILPRKRWWLNCCCLLVAFIGLAAFWLRLFPAGEPELFGAFGGVDIQKRYATKEEALEGHKRMCVFIETCVSNQLLKQ